MKNKSPIDGLYIEMDLINPRWFSNTPCELLFHVQKTSKNDIFPEYPNDCKCDIDLK